MIVCISYFSLLRLSVFLFLRSFSDKSNIGVIAVFRLSWFFVCRVALDCVLGILNITIF